MKWLGIMLTAVLLAGVPGYGSAQQPAKKGTPPATQSQDPGQQAAKSYTPKEREDYQKKIAGDLKEVQQKIGGLNAKRMTLPQQSKRMFNKAMVDLQRKMSTARNKLAALEKASEKEWSGLKDNMDKALDELANTYKEIESRFK